MSPGQQAVHVEVLLDQRHVRRPGRDRPRPRAAKTSYSLPKPQLPMFLPAKSSGDGDAGVGEGHLQRARALEDLGDVDDVGALLTRLQRLRHPGDGEVDLAVGEELLGDMPTPVSMSSTSRHIAS